MNAATRMIPLIALALALTSCGHTNATSKPPAATAAVPPSTEAPKAPPAAQEPADRARLADPGPPPSTESMSSVMAEHFLVTSWARDAVISGQLELLREPLMLLADSHYDAVTPSAWQPWITQLRAASKVTAEAETLDAAAMGVATMSRVCGECHRATGGGPKFSTEANEVFLPYRETFPERMGRHMWAAEQLWRGLTVPSDESWNAGAVALRDAPEEMDEWLPDSFAANLAEIRRLGEAADGTDDIAKRAEIYGTLLATCAGCHNRFLEHGL